MPTRDDCQSDGKFHHKLSWQPVLPSRERSSRRGQSSRPPAPNHPSPPPLNTPHSRPDSHWDLFLLRSHRPTRINTAARPAWIIMPKSQCPKIKKAHESGSNTKLTKLQQVILLYIYRSLVRVVSLVTGHLELTRLFRQRMYSVHGTHCNSTKTDTRLYHADSTSEGLG